MKQDRRRIATELADFRNGRDSNAFAEFPMALLSERVEEGQKTLEFNDTIQDWKSGRTLERRVRIVAADSLPTATDEDILLALMQLTLLANNFTNPEVEFTKNQVVSILGWEDRGGWAFDRVETSLHRWKSTSIHFWNSWRDHGKGVWRDSEAIGVIEYFKVADGRKAVAGQPTERSRFVWNKVLFESFKSGYLKTLDFEKYRQLTRSSSRRAFRFLDKRFFHSPKWELDLRTFACEKIGLSRNYDTGELKNKLKPAMDELTDIGFIHPVRYVKRAKKKWQIEIEKNCGSLPNASEVAAIAPLASQLIELGVSAKVASELVASFAAASIGEKIRLFEWLQKRNDRRLLKNPAGFLVAAIRNDYPLPKALQPRDPRTARTGGSRRLPIVPRATDTSDRAEPAATVPKPSALADWWQSLSVAKRAAFMQKVSRKLSKFEADTLLRLEGRGGKLLEEFRFSLVERYLRAAAHPDAA